MCVGVAGRHSEQRFTTSGLVPLSFILSGRGKANIITEKIKFGEKRLEISVRRPGAPNRCSPPTLCLIGLPIEYRVKKCDPAKKKNSVHRAGAPIRCSPRLYA